MITSLPILVVASSLLAPPTPQSVLKGAINHYKTLKSFSMTIQHSNSSGLFPGVYTQSLKWRKGDAFELLVTKKTDYQPTSERPGGVAPNYYCSDGATVTSVWKDHPRSDEGLTHDSNTSPGWEVSGGLILSALLGSPDAELIFSPPAGMSVQWTWGKATTWQGETVKDVVIGWQAQGRSQDIDIYVSPSGLHIVGFSFKNDGGGRPGWAHYMKQEENPVLPKSLGKAPK